MTGARRAALWTMHRLLWAAPVIVGVTALTFFLIHLAPGDPIYLLAGDSGTAAYYADMRAKYGLDRSLLEQFVRYAGAIARGDFGHSFMYQRPVAGLLLDHLFASLLLGLTALSLAAGGGFFAGVAAASARSRAFDAVIRGGASLAYAAGASGHVVAQQLGHTSARITRDAYATPQAQAMGKIRQMTDALGAPRLPAKKAETDSERIPSATIEVDESVNS